MAAKKPVFLCEDLLYGVSVLSVEAAVCHRAGTAPDKQVQKLNGHTVESSRFEDQKLPFTILNSTDAYMLSRLMNPDVNLIQDQDVNQIQDPDVNQMRDPDVNYMQGPSVNQIQDPDVN